MERLQIRMFGDFSLHTENQQISDCENRSRKIWLLLAYLIYNRSRNVEQEELTCFLWGDEPRNTNPAGALKAALHRVRGTLDRLWPSCGRELIVCKGGSCGWNPSADIIVDTELFEQLCSKQAESEEEQLRIDLEALDLYRGEFLENLPADPWIAPLRTHYHALYVQVLLDALPMLMNRNRQNEVISLCERACSVEPNHELIHQYYMRALLDQGERTAAASVYRQLSERLFSQFGVIPQEELRDLYHEATRCTGEQVLSLDIVAEQLHEDQNISGALICEYDFFITLCRSVARSMMRTGFATHVVLMTVTDDAGAPLSRRSLPRVMENLEQQIRTGLRKGDAAARCSLSQFVLMLPQANYENSCMVAGRIIRSFARQYPHSPAVLQYTVYPLQPNP